MPLAQLEVVFFRHSFPGSSDGKASACHAGDPGSIPGLQRSPGEGNGNPLQYSFFFFRYTVLLTFKTNVMIIEIIIGRAFNK